MHLDWLRITLLLVGYNDIAEEKQKTIAESRLAGLEQIERQIK
jgi:hypothetical protein